MEEEEWILHMTILSAEVMEYTNQETILMFQVLLELLDLAKKIKLAEKQTRGISFSKLTLAARTNFSPTTEPIEPPIKLKSKAAATSETPFT